MRNKTVLLAAGCLASLVLVPALTLAGGSFFIDDATSFVGIGNTTPASRLDVSGAMYSRMVTASSTALDWNLGNVQSKTLSSNETLTFSNGQAGGRYTLIINQDSTGGRTITWPASVKWAGGTAPTLTSSANATDWANFIYDGTNYLGSFNAGDSSSTLLNGLVSYWKLDESSGTREDSYGSNGLSDNNTVGSAAGIINLGADFAAANSEFLSGASAIADMNTYTISLWVKSSATSSSSLISTDGTGRAIGDFRINMSDSGTIEFVIDTGTADDNVNYNNGYNDGQWHFVVVTGTGSMLNLYIDGSEVASSSSSIDLNAQDRAWAFGANYTQTIYYSGLLDEIGVWDRALTGNEVSQLYNDGNGLQYPF